MTFFKKIFFIFYFFLFLPLSPILKKIQMRKKYFERSFSSNKEGPQYVYSIRLKPKLDQLFCLSYLNLWNEKRREEWTSNKKIKFGPTLYVFYMTRRNIAVSSLAYISMISIICEKEKKIHDLQDERNLSISVDRYFKV